MAVDHYIFWQLNSTDNMRMMIECLWKRNHVELSFGISKKGEKLQL